MSKFYQTLYLPGDLVFTRGYSWKSRLIRFFSHRIGESRTQVNHVGVLIDHGYLHQVRIVEALSTVQLHGLREAYGGTKHEVAIFRAHGLAMATRNRIADRAKSYVGKSYGYLKIAAHFLDWCLLGAYCFRRLAKMEDYPICSWLASHAYDPSGITFGVTDEAASPDDLWDYCVANPREFTCIRKLSLIA